MSWRRAIGAGIFALVLLGVMWGAWYSRPGPKLLPEFQSYFMQPTFVDNAFASVGSVSAQPAASMVLVNHHLLASQLIARALAQVATHEPVTVVLIAPDHFAAGAAPITSVIARWPTSHGMIEADSETINALASRGVIHLQGSPFGREHGITNITMFIARALPRATLVPIIVRDNASASVVDACAKAIAQLPGRVIVVGSFDFTHEATDAIARRNDVQSLRILEEGNPDTAGAVIVDGPGGIRMLMRIASMRGLRFTLLDATNSARITGNLAQTDVTSYITGYWAPAP